LSFKDGYCKCFACGKGGSSIDVAMQLFDLSAAEAANRLCADFGIEGFASKDVSAHQRQQQAQAKLLYQRFNEWSASAHHTLSDYLRMLRGAQNHLSPNDQGDTPHALFLESLQNLAVVEYYLQVLEHGTDRDKIEFFKQNRKVVKQYEQRLCFWRAAGFSW